MINDKKLMISNWSDFTVLDDLEKWDESKHPRRGKGPHGGEFAPKGQGGGGGGGEPAKLSPPHVTDTPHGQEVSYVPRNPDVDDLPEVKKWRQNHYKEAVHKLMVFGIQKGIDGDEFTNALTKYGEDVANFVSPQDAYKEFSKAAHKIMDGKVDAADYLRLENAIRVADWRFIKNLNAGGGKPEPKPKPEPEPKKEAWQPHPISDEEMLLEMDYAVDDKGHRRKGVSKEQYFEFRRRQKAFSDAAFSPSLSSRGASLKGYVDDFIKAGFLPRDPNRPYTLISEDGKDTREIGGANDYMVQLARNYLDVVMNRGDYKRSYDIDAFAQHRNDPHPKPGNISGAEAAKKIDSMYDEDMSPELKDLRDRREAAEIAMMDARAKLRDSKPDNTEYRNACEAYYQAANVYTNAKRKYNAKRTLTINNMLKVDKPLSFDVNTDDIKESRLSDRVDTGVKEFQRRVSGDLKLEYSGVRFVQTNERSFFRNSENAIYADTTDHREMVVPHELGHWLEHSNRGARLATNKFLKDRTAGEPTIKLNTLSDYRGYDDDEVCKKDKFFDAYCGKMYTTGSTEILSMGIAEYIFNPLRFAHKDPEYFALIYDICHGAYEKQFPT